MMNDNSQNRLADILRPHIPQELRWCNVCHVRVIDVAQHLATVMTSAGVEVRFPTKTSRYKPPIDRTAAKLIKVQVSDPVILVDNSTQELIGEVQEYKYPEQPVVASRAINCDNWTTQHLTECTRSHYRRYHE